MRCLVERFSAWPSFGGRLTGDRQRLEVGNGVAELGADLLAQGSAPFSAISGGRHV